MSEDHAGSPLALEQAFRLEQTEAHWIWPAAMGEGVNQYVEFRHEFSLDRPDPDAELLLSADSNYAVWINGTLVDCGQYHDYPGRKTYDRLAVGSYFQPGVNRLVVSVHYQGVDSFQYIKGPPGLIFALRYEGRLDVSGRDTRYRPSPGYHSGPIARTTSQLGFTFQYDARAAGEAWRPIQPEDLRGDARARGLTPRPLAKLHLKSPAPATICAQGIFRRDAADTAANQSIAQLMQRDFLSPRFTREMFDPTAPLTLPSDSGITVAPACLKSDGAYLVIDLGREEAGLLELDVDADAGTCLDIAHGEHLDDLRVRAAVGGRHFASRYVCKQGRQRFIHGLSRLAGRFVELHVSGGERCKLHYAGIRPTEYPLARAGEFHCADSLHDRIYDTAVRTLRLCMHEHYEDCPWREQALYAFDSRNQALYGYYAFGEYRFPAASFALLGEGLQDDGYLEMCAPARIDITIPMFSFAWVLAVDDYWMYSADRAFVQRAMSWIERMMRAHLARLEGELLPCPVGPRYWHFYEWASGLDGSKRLGESDPPRFDAPLNLMFCLALRAAARLCEALGDPATASRWREVENRVRGRIAAVFWDEAQAAFRTYVGAEAPPHFSEFVQSLALLARVPAPLPAITRLRERLTHSDNGLVATTLSHCHYKFEALMMDKQAYGKWVFDTIARDWGGMLMRGASSFWETIRGGDDFNQAGSLCHGWSAVPVYFYTAYLLGIRPVEPGFRRFSIDPLPGVVESADGVVSTPFGPITVQWQSEGGQWHRRRLTHPDSIHPMAEVTLADGLDSP